MWQFEPLFGTNWKCMKEKFWIWCYFNWQEVEVRENKSKDLHRCEIEQTWGCKNLASYYIISKTYVRRIKYSFIVSILLNSFEVFFIIYTAIWWSAIEKIVRLMRFLKFLKHRFFCVANSLPNCCWNWNRVEDSKKSNSYKFQIF